MSDSSHTRRGFLTQLSVGIGVGIAGGIGLHKLLGGDAPAHVEQTPAQAPAPAGVPQIALDAVTLAGPMMIHVRDVANAEVAMMVGTRQLIYRDPELVSRLVSTATKSAG